MADSLDALGPGPLTGDEPDSAQPGSALQMFSRPPVRTRPASAGMRSTLFKMSAFNSLADMSRTERIRAAAPATWGAAMEPPLTNPYFPLRSVE